MAQLLVKRLICASAALALTVGAAFTAASTGHLRVGAGGMELVLEPGEQSLITVSVSARSCPPECGFMDLSWHKERANPSLLILGTKIS